jgi:hypothetical protein
VRPLLAEELAISAEQHVGKQEWRPAAELLQSAAALQPDSQSILNRLAEVRAGLGQPALTFVTRI